MRSCSPDSVFKQPGRHCERSEAIQFFARCTRKLDCFVAALLATTARNTFSLAARSTRGLPSISRPLRSEGAGNAGRRCARGKKCTVVTTVTPETPGIPRAMVLRLTSRSWRSGSFATVTCGIASTGLTPTSRCQGHTTWPSAEASPVSHAAASTASRPDVRDVRETPLWVERDASDIDSSRVKRQRNIFRKGTGQTFR
jgi:hypothetical protein